MENKIPGTPDVKNLRHFNIYNKSTVQFEPTFVSTGRQIESIANTKPNEIAIIEINRDDTCVKTITWRELYLKSNQLAWMFKEQGVTAKSTVMVCLPNTIGNILCAYAAWKNGACYLPVAPRSTDAEIDTFAKMAKPQIIVSDGYHPEGYRCFTETELMERLKSYSEKMPPDCLAIPSRAQTTGGSTGKPKLIRINRPAGESDESLMSWFFMTGQFFGCRQLVCGPMFHGAPCSAAFSGLNAGNLVVMPNNFKPASIQRYIKEYGIECIQMVPTLMHRMLKLSTFNPDDVKTLKALCSTGGYCSPALKEAWMKILGPKNVYEIYSMTEMIGMTVIRGDEWLKHKGSVGKPYGGCKIEVRDEQGNVLPAGEVGEIFMTPSGGYLETEYVGREQLADSGRGFRSVGDMGYVDEDGYLYFADRRSDMIVTGGENVFALDVENVFLQHPDIVDMVVVGIPDPEWGRRIHAIMEVNRDFSYDEFRRYGWKFLLPFKVPKTIEFVDALPRKDSGKLNRMALAALCEQLQKGLVAPFGLIETGLRKKLQKDAEEAEQKKAETEAESDAATQPEAAAEEPKAEPAEETKE